MDLHTLTEQSDLQLSDFVPLGKIGEGAFSDVYKVRNINDGKIYALKKIRISALKPRERQYAVNEIKILSSISSKFVISYRESFYDSTTQQLCIVMEWANEGDLNKDIATRRKQNNDSFPESEIWRAIRDILKGLNLLHSNCILHRDIKAANIFKSEGVYKVGDLNVAKICPKMLARTQTGTPYYASPEIWDEQPYDQKSDIWSFGCVVYEICELRHPFESPSMQRLHKAICQGVFQPIHKKYSKQLQQLIQICLNVNPKDRLNSKELLSLGWVRDKLKMYKIENRSAFKTEPRNCNYSSFKKMPLMRPRSRRFRLLAPTEHLTPVQQHAPADQKSREQNIKFSAAKRKHYASNCQEYESGNDKMNDHEPSNKEHKASNPHPNLRREKSQRFVSESLHQQFLAQQQKRKEPKYYYRKNNYVNLQRYDTTSKFRKNNILRSFQLNNISNASRNNNPTDTNPTLDAKANRNKANGRQVGTLRSIIRPFSAETNCDKANNSKCRNNLNSNFNSSRNAYRQQDSYNSRSIRERQKQEERRKQDDRNKGFKQRRETSNTDIQQNVPNKILREIISNRAKNIHEKYAEQLQNPSSFSNQNINQNSKVHNNSLYRQQISLHADQRMGANQDSKAELSRQQMIKGRSELSNNLNGRLAASKLSHIRPSPHYLRPMSEKYRYSKYFPMQASVPKR